MQTELSERKLDYGVRIIKVEESLPKALVGRRIGDQLLQWDVGGRELRGGAGCGVRDDFVHKLQVA